MIPSNIQIGFDVTNVKECAVPKDKFKVNNYTFGQVPMEDLVHTTAPFIHLQILRPKDDEQRRKALEYFQKHGKKFLTFADRKDILLYLGATEDIYIKSTQTPVEINELNNLLPQAAHWFRFYGDKQTE